MMEEIKRKPMEMWTDEKSRILYMYMSIGNCILCKTPIYDSVPQNVMVSRDPSPLFCDDCRKGILKLVRPELIEFAKQLKTLGGV